MKKTVYTMKVVVEGSGTFPIDMLRYDSCVPATESDAHAINREESGKRTVVLRRYAGDNDVMRHHAGKRWAAYGWPVIVYEAEER